MEYAPALKNAFNYLLSYQNRGGIDIAKNGKKSNVRTKLEKIDILHPDRNLSINFTEDYMLSTKGELWRKKDDITSNDTGDIPTKTDTKSKLRVPDYILLILNEVLTLAGNVNVINIINSKFGPNACSYQVNDGKYTRLGIWTDNTYASFPDKEKSQFLNSVTINDAGKMFALWVNVEMIRKQIYDNWKSTPKTYNSDFRPDNNGPIHINNIDFTLESPNRMITKIFGTDERPWPDVDFTLTSADTLSTTLDSIVCTTKNYLDVDKSWLNALTGIFTGLATIFGIFVNPWLILPAGLFGGAFLTESIYIYVKEGEVSSGNTTPGQLFASYLNQFAETPVPGRFKVALLYEDIEIGSGGVCVRGTIMPHLRNPRINIEGGGQMSINRGLDSVAKKFKLSIPGENASDLLWPLRYQWTADGKIEQVYSPETSITFSTKGASGDILKKKVHLQVTDNDGLTASADTTAEFYIVEPEDYNDADNRICRKKPWLPVCKQ
jgi:hypothetical protein